jgi:hypothetical protein
MNNKYFKDYRVSFIIPYASYMGALQRGMVFHGARLKPGRVFSYSKVVLAKDREKAVYDSLQWYWEEIKSEWGQACNIMTVSDPYNEVCYWDDFNCSDRSNNYLDESTKARVIAASSGLLVINDTTGGSKHHRKNCLRRIKRRRVYLQRISTNVYEHPTTGVMYYRETVIPQKSTGGSQGKPGKLLAKRKVENIRLNAKSLQRATSEIAKRFGVTLNNE